MIDLSTYSIEDLKKLSICIIAELEKRAKDIITVKKDIEELTAEEYTFDFYAEGGKKTPFVARCLYNKSEPDGIERIFKNLDRTKGYRDVVVSGKYKAKEKEILDIRDKNSRYYYIVLEGELVQIGNPDIAKQVASVKQYLKGDIERDTLLELNGVKKVEAGVIDELKD